MLRCDLHEQARVRNDFVLLQIELLNLLENVPDEITMFDLVSLQASIDAS